MSKEMDLLKRILATGWLDHELSCEVEELLAQPEQNKAEAIMPNGVRISNVYAAYEEGRKSVMSEQEPTTRHALDSYWNQEAYQRGYAQAEPDLKREPLSDEEVIAKYRAITLYAPSYYAGFRDAEKAHGIGGGE